MLGIYNYTVVLTYFGMLAAFTGITHAIHGDIHTALVCLMISGFCDMLDGKIASTKKDRTLRERRFGVQIDSLSDLICFGALPAVIVYTAAQGSNSSFYISGLYLLCALILLAWFNVDEEERQERETGSPGGLLRPSGHLLCSYYPGPIWLWPPLLLALTHSGICGAYPDGGRFF